MKKTHELLLQRVIELGQVALTVHEDLQRWREPALTSPERAILSTKLQGALSDQREIIDAILDDCEEQP